jgi:hypothetical protein
MLSTPGHTYDDARFNPLPHFKGEGNPRYETGGVNTAS